MPQTRKNPSTGNEYGQETWGSWLVGRSGKIVEDVTFGPSDNTVTAAETLLFENWGTGGEAISIVSSSDFNLLRGIFEMQNSVEIIFHLGTRPDIVGLLFDAYRHIRKYFPSNRVLLEWGVDPEEPEFEQFTIQIVSDDSVDKTLSQLDRFDDDWWLEASARFGTNLCVTTTYL